MSADHDPREPRAGSPEQDDCPTLSRRTLLAGGLSAAASGAGGTVQVNYGTWSGHSACVDA